MSTTPQNGSSPPVWQMIKQAMEELGPATTNVEVRDWILEKWPGTNKGTIACWLIGCTVNHHSRIHYSGNQRERVADAEHDFLFRPARGKLIPYDPAKHGVWEIVIGDDDRLIVQQVEQDQLPGDHGGSFAAEAHLRDYLAQNLDLIEPGLTLFVDDEGNDGVEYVTPVGRLDLLAEAPSGDLVIIELKVGRTPDTVVGQILRYKGWIKRHLANGRHVRGFIISQRISEKLKYAAADVQDVALKTYQLSVKIGEVEGLD